jgi:hypothetical protein
MIKSRPVIADRISQIQRPFDWKWPYFADPKDNAHASRVELGFDGRVYKWLRAATKARFQSFRVDSGAVPLSPGAIESTHIKVMTLQRVARAGAGQHRTRRQEFRGRQS